jgi:hypothetical protein
LRFPWWGVVGESYQIKGPKITVGHEKHCGADSSSAHRDLEAAITAEMMACSAVRHEKQAIRDGYATEKEKFMKGVERKEMVLEEIKAAMAAHQVLLDKANADITLQNREAKDCKRYWSHLRITELIPVA